jgi:hypothetical protein
MTKQVAHVIGGLYVIYAFFNMRASTLLFSLAVGLIVLGLLGSMEVAVAATIVSGLVLKMFFKGFEGFQTINPVDVEKRLAGMRAAAPAGEPLSTQVQTAAAAQPVLSSSLAEGFSDVTPTNAAAEADGKKSASSASSASSAPAPAPAPAAPSASGPTAAGFTGGGGDGIFKLGEMPSEAAGGPHLDASSTILNAMQALKPDQIKSLTDDTRQLLDTQKSLMGMLENMKPMLKDGAQLINTFGGMFGGAKPGQMQFGGQGGQAAMNMIGSLGGAK